VAGVNVAPDEGVYVVELHPAQLRAPEEGADDMAGLIRFVASAALCLIVGACRDADLAGPGSTPPPSREASSTPTGTPPPIADCPREVPEPSGAGPGGAFVPSDPSDVLMCRYEWERAATWNLTVSRVLPHSEAIRLAAELNRAEGPEPGFKCPATTVWEAWVFRGESQVVVKAGWCNLVVGHDRTIKRPPGW
jgi:hypothetical protein